MKKIMSSVLMALMAVMCMYADYPELYLRGEMTSDGWGANENLKFTNDNGVYTLHLDNLHGQFKIADANWGTHIYGCDSDNDGGVTITGSGNYTMRYQGIKVGGNFGCDDLNDVTLKFTYVEGQNLTLEVTVGGEHGGDPRLSGTLPVLYINVYTDETHSALNDEIISKDLDHKNYFSFAEYWLDMNGCEWMAQEGAQSLGSKEEPLPLEIKARGNWTRKGFSKKPFKLKLGKKQKMLGMTKSKHFALLAHADDARGYLKNFVGFNLGKRIGLPWTPAQQPVEVIINGDYRGLYFLTESIRIDSERVNITELDDNATDPSLVSGGYLVELDNYDEENQIRMEEKSCVGDQLMDVLRVTWDTPEEYSDIQKRFITDQFTAMNDAVGANSDILWSYIDLDDAARYYIVEEIISHTESYHGSTYLFRDRGENQKWHFSPLWDCGNAFSGPDNDFFYNHDLFGNTWIPSIRTNDMFNEKVKQTWLWFMNNGYNGIYDDIEAYVNHLGEAAKADHRRWDGQPVPDGGAPVSDNRDMQGRKNEVLGKLRAKTEWLKGVFGDYSAAGVTSEPARDQTPAAPLPEYITSGVENVGVDAVASDSPVEYYDLTGRRVASPQDGAVVIERRGPVSRLVRF